MRITLQKRVDRLSDRLGQEERAGCGDLSWPVLAGQMPQAGVADGRERES